MRLVLASASPRRRQLLALAGFSFEVHAADIDETERPGESPAGYVGRLALEKAAAVLARFPEAIILGADTTVAVDGAILAKPTDAVDAGRMLRLLANRSHEVQTGIAVVTRDMQLAHVETTTVFFSAIPEDELAHYLSTGDSLDKAGAYGIQGYSARWIPRIEGDFFNVMGLPLHATARLLTEIP